MNHIRRKNKCFCFHSAIHKYSEHASEEEVNHNTLIHHFYTAFVIIRHQASVCLSCLRFDSDSLKDSVCVMKESKAVRHKSSVTAFSSFLPMIHTQETNSRLTPAPAVNMSRCQEKCTAFKRNL